MLQHHSRERAGKEREEPYSQLWTAGQSFWGSARGTGNKHPTTQTGLPSEYPQSAKNKSEK